MFISGGSYVLQVVFCFLVYLCWWVDMFKLESSEYGEYPFFPVWVNMIDNQNYLSRNQKVIPTL